MSARKKYLLITATVYAIVLSALVWSLFVLRQSVLSNFSSIDARGDWQTWRSDVEHEQQQPQTVARRVPKSAEPPALVLMRDYFVTCLVGTVLFVSLLYWVFAALAIGAITTR
jgi:hypothetical protein